MGFYEEQEGICDDCNAPLEYISRKEKTLWHCTHCELFLEWYEKGEFYVTLSSEEVEKEYGIKNIH